MSILGKDSYVNVEKQKIREKWKKMCHNTCELQFGKYCQDGIENKFISGADIAEEHRSTYEEAKQWTPEQFVLYSQRGAEAQGKNWDEELKHMLNDDEAQQRYNSYLCLPSRECIEIERVTKPLGILESSICADDIKMVDKELSGEAEEAQ